MFATYFRESVNHVQCRAPKEHASNFSRNKDHIRNFSAVYKDLIIANEGREQGKTFPDCFYIRMLKVYKKAFTKCVEEGLLISSCGGEILNSKSKWHQTKGITTTTRHQCFSSHSLRGVELA